MSTATKPRTEPAEAKAHRFASALPNVRLFENIDPAKFIQDGFTPEYVAEQFRGDVYNPNSIGNHYPVNILISIKDLPEFLEVDMGPVVLDQTLHLSDIKLPKGVELTAFSHDNDEDHAIANIHEAKAVAEPVAEEAATPETSTDENKDGAPKSE